MAENITQGIFHLLLESSGGMQDIKRAMDTKDLAAIVKAATGVLRKTSATRLPLAERKSAELSTQFRTEGNVHYKNKDYPEAILSYNKALAFAPNNSLEVTLAYGNISAVLLTIGAYRDCQMSIKAAQKLECPEFLLVKLKKRKLETEKHMFAETIRDMKIISEAGLPNFTDFAVERHPEVPCVSTDVCIDSDKKVVAAKEIKSGTLVAFERAFVSVQDENDEYISCYYCHRMCFFFIPCEGCCKALFCKMKCKEQCLEDYHRVECHVVNHIQPGIYKQVNKLAVRAAIKMSMKLGWEKLRVASLEMGEKRLKKSSLGEAFDCNNPVSMLCYNDGVNVPTDVMVDASLTCAAVVDYLGRVPGYLPEGEKSRENAIAALSRIMLHLSTTFVRKVLIKCSAFDISNNTYTYGVQRNTGWFSFTSKLAHSCEPNLLVVGFNDHVGLVALQRIKKGEPLTISYIAHFYDMTIPQKNMRTRQHIIYNAINYQCKCRVCLLEWSDRSQVPIKLTDRQKAAYKQYKSVMISALNCSFKQKMEAIGVALDELDGCINTTKHFEAYEDLKGTLNISQCANDLNRRYKCQKTHVFLLEE